MKIPVSFGDFLFYMFEVSLSILTNQRVGGFPQGGISLRSTSPSVPTSNENPRLVRGFFVLIVEVSLSILTNQRVGGSQKLPLTILACLSTPHL
jgi:hypothetical protein